MSQTTRGEPIVPMIQGTDTPHRPLASLFFYDVRDESARARDDERRSFSRWRRGGRTVISMGAAQALAEALVSQQFAGLGI